LYKLLSAKSDFKVNVERVHAALEHLGQLAFVAPPLLIRPELFTGRAVHLYTDASLSLLGAVLFLDGKKHLAFSVPVPPRWLFIGKKLQNPIITYEALAVWTAASTFAGELSGRRVYIWVDNIPVKDALLAGYCKGASGSGEQMNGVIGSVHRQFLFLNAHIYVCYCQTKFNIADILTREELLHKAGEFSLSMVPAVVPV
jgi:hypothetical protein